MSNSSSSRSGNSNNLASRDRESKMLQNGDSQHSDEKIERKGNTAIYAQSHILQSRFQKKKQQYASQNKSKLDQEAGHSHLSYEEYSFATGSSYLEESRQLSSKANASPYEQQRIPSKISARTGFASVSKVLVDPVTNLQTLTDNSSTPTNNSCPRITLESYQIFRYQCGMFVKHPKMQLFIVALIAVNALMMGIATFDFVENNQQLTFAFNRTDLIFLIIFTIELVLQFVFRGWRLFRDGWLIFDLIVITMSWSLARFQIIRAFRVLRALRLITRVKVMQNLVLGEKFGSD
jgi:hypothetical protein